MKTKKLIESWKNDQTVDNTPAVVNEEVVNQIHGGFKFSGGFICTISAECNGGTSCWPVLPSLF